MLNKAHQFNSLSSQVAAAIRQEIKRGTWKEWLPGERVLTETLQVSRKTLRKALGQLQREALIESQHGVGNRILRQRNLRTPSATSLSLVALLTPDPLERMRPYTSLWVSQLKTLLGQKGITLQSHYGRKFFSRRPGRALSKLMTQVPAGCWLLANSTAENQKWFADHEVPCVISGSCHSGIDLPHADLDHYALCRHAAGILLSAGHRRMALLNERSGRAGDMESEAGFIAGVRKSPHTDAVPLVIHHEHSPSSLVKVIQNLIRSPRPPTALLLSNGASYLTVTSTLAQHGLRVPQDVSVVSRDDESFFEFLVPSPARYASNPQAFAKKLLKPISQILAGETVVPRSTRLLPAFTKGKSLAPPRQHPLQVTA